MPRNKGRVEAGSSSRANRGDGPRTSFGPPPRSGRGGGRRGGNERSNVPSNQNVAGTSLPAPSSSTIPLGGPGPLDPALLTLQSHHRSKDVWEGDSKECTFRGGHPLPMHPRIHQILRDCGLYGIVLMSGIKCDRPLLKALLERWRPETHSFHLLVGEMTVTLQDVSVITGLPVDGQAVTGSMDFDAPYLVEQYLGVQTS